MEGLAPPQEAAAAPAGADIASLIAEEVSAPHCCTPLSNGMAVAQPAYGGRHCISCAAGAGEKAPLMTSQVESLKKPEAKLVTYHSTGITGLVYLAFTGSAGACACVDAARLLLVGAPPARRLVSTSWIEGYTTWHEFPGGISPVDFVTAMSKEVKATKQCKSRCLASARLHPSAVWVPQGELQSRLQPALK